MMTNSSLVGFEPDFAMYLGKRELRCAINGCDEVIPRGAIVWLRPFGMDSGGPEETPLMQFDVDHGDYQPKKTKVCPCCSRCASMQLMKHMEDTKIRLNRELDEIQFLHTPRDRYL